MAYKFQLGEAKLSGSITQTDGTTTLLGLDNSEANISNVGEIEADVIQPDSNTLSLKGGSGNVTSMILDGIIVDTQVPIQLSGALKLQFNGTDDTIGIDGGTGNLEISGASDISINAPAGDVDIALHDGTNGLKLNGTLVTATATELNYNDITTLGTSENSKVVTANADGDITLAGASSNIVFDKSANALEFADNSKITFGTGDDASIYWDGSNLNIGVESSATPILIGNATSEVTIQDNLTINGNLTILGATVSASVESLIIQDALINIGDGQGTYADGYGIEFGTSGSGGWAQFKTAQVNSANHLSSSLPLAAPSFYGDGSNLTGVAATNAKVAVNDIDDAATDTINGAGLWFAGNLSQDCTVTLTHASAWSDGDVVYIKNNDANNKVIISANGGASETIDGVDQDISLETQGAAVTLIHKGTTWLIV